MRIEVGKTYISDGGEAVTIERTDGALDWPYMSHEGRWYSAEGICIDGQVSLNLIRDVGAESRPQPREMLLPSDPAVRKDLPITSGVLDYFPLAVAEVARVSKAGNDQHNPGQPLHWDKTKSLDHADCIPRHLIDRNARDTDGMRHSAKLAWRALALLETQLQAERDAERG